MPSTRLIPRTRPAFDKKKCDDPELRIRAIAIVNVDKAGASDLLESRPDLPALIFITRLLVTATVAVARLCSSAGLHALLD